MRAVVSLIVAATACANRGHVEVDVFGASDFGARVGRGGPIEGAVVAFRDRDGSSTSTRTDAEGHADGEVEAGGSVWCSATGDLLVQGTNVLVAYEDVQPGDVLTFGAPTVERARVATIHVSVPPPPPPPVGMTFIDLFTSCTRSMDPVTRAIELDDRCSGTVDILVAIRTVVSTTSTPGPYYFLPAQPIVDGGTIAVTGAGRPLDTVSVPFTNLDGATVDVRRSRCRARSPARNHAQTSRCSRRSGSHGSRVRSSNPGKR